MPLQQIDKPVAYINTETQEYPVTEMQIRELFPNVSFPVPFVPPSNFAPVFPAPQPSYDHVVQVAVEGKPVLTEKGHYEQSWDLIIDRFTDYTDADGVFHSKEEQEAAAIAADKAQKAEALTSSIVAATQLRLDQWAKTRNYDGILSLCTYATSTVSKFATEGQAGVNARDETWEKLYQILDDVKQGLRPAPSGYDEIEPELPALTWPND